MSLLHKKPKESGFLTILLHMRIENKKSRFKLSADIQTNTITHLGMPEKAEINYTHI